MTLEGDCVDIMAVTSHIDNERIDELRRLIVQVADHLDVPEEQVSEMYKNLAYCGYDWTELCTLSHELKKLDTNDSLLSKLM